MPGLVIVIDCSAAGSRPAPEAWDRQAGNGIQRVKKIHYAHQNPPVVFVDLGILAVGSFSVGPVSEPAIRLRPSNPGIKLPPQTASRCVERKYFLCGRNS